VVNVFGKEYSRKELMKRIGDISQIGGINKHILNDGKAKGGLLLR